MESEVLGSSPSSIHLICKCSVSLVFQGFVPHSNLLFEPIAFFPILFFPIAHRSRSLFIIPFFVSHFTFRIPNISFVRFTFSVFVLRLSTFLLSSPRNFRFHLIFSSPNPGPLHLRSISISPLPTFVRIILFAEIMRSSLHQPAPSPFPSRVT
jgi:hypothetical protein